MRLLAGFGDPDIQRVLNDLQRSKLSSGRMIRLQLGSLLQDFSTQTVAAPENVVRTLKTVFGSSRYIVHLKQKKKLADQTAYHFSST